MIALLGLGVFMTVIPITFIIVMSYTKGWFTRPTKYELRRYAKCKEYYEKYYNSTCDDYNYQDKLIEIEFTDDDPSYYDDSNFETIFGKGE